MSSHTLSVNKSLHGLAHIHISQNFSSITAPTTLACWLCPINGEKKERKTKSQSTFAVLAPRLWNSLPEAISQTDDAYKMHITVHIKTHFYSLAF